MASPHADEEFGAIYRSCWPTGVVMIYINTRSEDAKEVVTTHRDYATSRS